MANKFHFDRVRKNFDRLKQELPVAVAGVTQNFFAESWRKQGWDDGTVTKWAPRKYDRPKDKGRAILVGPGRGRLRRAVQNSIREKRFDRIRLVIDGGTIPYASVHNEGGAVRVPATMRKSKLGKAFQVRAHVKQMPQRKFMGDSKSLRKIQVTTIKNHIDKVWRA